MSTSQQADPLIGRLVDGRYRVRARIARGGMATVYVATDLRLERRIALKVMHGHLSDDTVFQSRFIQEARAAARLADPHVVNVFDQGQDGDMAYLVMEYLPGITLRELMREQRRLTVPQTVTIMDAILSGLAAAHRAGIVHRDVKPENVLLAEDGRIKIGDFGLARATTANTATGAQLLGTIAYLAPELVTRGMADARSDIYSLGIMLYEMLVGEQPYKGEQPMQIAFQHATDSVPRPSVKNPGVPEQLDELVLWATEKSPDDRPNDAKEMLDRLRAIEHELGIAPQVARTISAGIIRDESSGTGELTQVLPAALTGPTTAVEDVDNSTRLRAATKRRAVRGGWLFALVILLAALAGGVGWWFGSGPGSQIAVPDVTDRTFAEAQQILAEQSFQAVQKDVFDLEIAPGIVVATDPPAGSRLDKDSTVEVLVSQGPQPREIQSLAGSSANDARGILVGLNLQVAEPDEEFFTDAAEGTVIGVSVTPRAGGDAVDCSQGCTALEGDTVTLSVSVGPVPDVTGQSVESASAALSERGLSVGGTVEETSDEFDRGQVMYIADRDGGGSWRPGESVTLVVSAGPPLFPVPNIVGMTRDQAKAALTGAGFDYEYATLWNAVLDEITKVESQLPGAGTQHPKGTVVSFRIQGAF
ncbi:MULTISPECIES: Stk1 family PASTA domain-containing Ser/Thr kinase [unclassified Microbacterium]|uniref:Stk1 family PASTA domain-containing Ser/Thr kinase n=1 Tax=unclassified Microbacterium TaxID=2609290 RepID=UPI00214C65A7|nr:MULTISPECIES: Stk1 family PASTA domain-containing Ser/Thr kinase [unclassified Microbacterium]MCR2809142.1 Stk1 family PASTA domain-containing Ser/Thr kinase [Microbacterium sp. zg.B185]WIM20294.1 Stk1 family PASTA domain-containing Ser/Thr kinase [Microbacterium sp. zg-B185]